MHARIPLLCVMVLSIALSSFSQDLPSYWTPVNEADIPETGTRYIVPTKYETFHLDLNDLDELLITAPTEIMGQQTPTDVVFTLPDADGNPVDFYVYYSPIMEQGLADQYPEIRTYAGYADDGSFIRLDHTPQGFHAMVWPIEGETWFVDPYRFGNIDPEHYVIYSKDDFHRSEPEFMDCGVVGESLLDIHDIFDDNARYGDCQHREYRLAISATAEYTIFHSNPNPPSVAIAQAAQVTTMNRVNGVFEQELAIRMTFIANNNSIIYTNAATDPFSNGNTGAMINENQTNTDAVIGSANYDIGHIFGTNSGGLAQLYSPCSSNKARGVTGSGAPVGDPFDIDYVAHEMGHQFGANHTQNNNCNRTSTTSMEPGSAATIMGYAGICAPNVQNNSDDYFHAISMQEMGAFITGASHTCPVTTALSNGAPSVTGTPGNITVPASTPFALTATATDPDGDPILYCWEQMDPTWATMPPQATNTGGPNFRSFDPTTDPTRYFPNLTDLATGITPTWEVLASVNRTMPFRVSVRDHAAGGGCSDHVDITVSVDATTGPFIVTVPSNTGITWAGNTNQTVTWNVAGTNAGAVACANVDIFLSTDGGATYPTQVASNVPNDGSESILVPNTATTTARIMVMCEDGTFFDISDNDFTITAATFDYTLGVTSNSASACQPNNATYAVNVGSIGGYTDPVTLSVSGVPAGATSNFSTNPVTPGNSSTLTISNTGAATPGVYALVLQGNSTSGIKTENLTLTINAGTPPAVTNSTPANGANNVAVPTTLTWAASASSPVTYTVDVATDAGFTSIVQSTSNIAGTSLVVNGLATSTTYYWRVRVDNACASSAYSPAFSFTTNNCGTIASTDVPVTISSSGTPIETSDLIIGPAGIITDLNIIGLDILHSYLSDLTVTLESPSGTVVTVFANQCGSADDLNMDYDDSGAGHGTLCTAPDGSTIQPAQALSAFNGEDQQGMWTLTVADGANFDGGSLEGWGLEICAITNDYTLAVSPTTDSECAGTDGVYTVTVGSIGGYSDPVTLSVSGLPGAAVASFSTNPVIPGNNTILTVTNTGGVTPGTHNFTLNGTSTSGNQAENLSLEVLPATPAQVTLLNPANGGGASTAPQLDWTPSASSNVTYTVQVATDAGFTSIVQTTPGITGTSLTLSGLSVSTQYFWRVRTDNACGSSAYTAAFNFTTSTCVNYASTNVPVAILADNGTAPFVEYTSTLTVPGAGIITDINLLDLDITHSWAEDIEVELESPEGTTVSILNQICGNDDNFDLNFDDAGAAHGTIPCPPIGGGTYQPNSPLSAFNSENPAGTWTMTITDHVSGDGGFLTGWTLEVCADPCIDPTVPTLSLDTDPMCPPGGSNNLNISGTLGSATAWHVYTGGCGTTPLGTTTTGVLAISPTSTTTYYVRGEGSCITPGTCATTTVTVGDSQNPTISCPANINQSTTDGACSLAVTVPAATGSDNCGVASITNDFNGTSDASDTYPVGTTTVVWTITDDNGNTNTCSHTVTVGSSTLQQPGAMTGPTNPCLGSSQTYSVPAVPNATSYNWTLPTGWTGTSTTNSITVTVGSSAGNISVEATNSCGTGPDRTLAVTVDDVPVQPGTITGTAAVCQNTAYTYSVAPVPNTTSYTWTIPSGWTGTSTTNTINVTSGTTASNISVTANNVCGSSTIRTLGLSIVNVPGQPGSMSGNANACVGSTETYSVAAVAGATSYIWSLPTGWTGTSTTNSINATVGANAGTITVTAVNACGNGTPRALVVTPNDVPAQPGTIAGSATPCNGSSQLYSITPVANTSSYTWTLPTGWGGSSTIASINATVGANSGNVTVAANNVCGTGPTQTLGITVNDVPSAAGSITCSPIQPCVGSTTTCSITPVSGATSYVWSLPSGWTGTSTTNSIVATAGAASGNVTVTPTNVCGSGTGSTQAVSSDDVPAQPGAMSGATDPCLGSSQTYSVAAVANTTGYTWTLPTGWTGTSATNSITVTVGANNGTISVTADNGCGSGTARSLGVTVDDVPAQPGAISGPTNPCVGASETYSVAAVPNTTSYTWTLPGGWSGTTSTNSINVTVGASGGTIAVLANNSCGAGIAQTLAVTTDDVPAQPGSISGASNPCVGASETYSVAAVPNTTSYTWTLPGGWTGTSTTNSINATVGASGGTISVTANNTCGSGTAQTLAVTTDDVPAQPGVISGVTTVCSGDSETYSITAVAGATGYTWTLPTGWTGTSTTNSINVTTGPNAGNVTVTADNVCGSSAAQTLAVSLQSAPAQPGAISGDANACVGTTETYSVGAVAGATSYIWSLPTGWTGASTTTSINATVGANSGNISVTAVNACGNSAAQTLAVTPDDVPAQAGAISGASNPCLGASETYSVAAVPNTTSYTWTLPSGWTGTSATNSINVTVGASGGTISVVANNTCGAGSAQTLAVNTDNVPTQPGAISGASNPCVGASETYSVVAVPNSTSYTWTLPGGWTGTSTTNSINATVGASGGTISVTAINACGSGTAQTLAVTADDVPAQPGSITGVTAPCVGASETYSVAAVPNTTSYTWTLPGGWTGTSTTNSITVTVGASGGTISVTANNTCGSGTVRTLAVTTDDVPAQPGAISGESNPCLGASETYSVTAVPNTSSYTWTLPTGWTGTSTSNSITVTAGAGNGTVSVTPNNGCGSGTAQTLAVTVDDVPAQPGFISGSTSTCAGSSETYSVAPVANTSSYTWSLPGGWTGSSTSNSITVTAGASGGTVSVTPNNSCGSGTAQTLAVTSNDVPAQPGAISGAGGPCVGSSQTYSIAAVANTTSYTWALPGGWTGTSTTNSINVTVGASSGSVSVTANNGCGSGSSQTLSISVTDVPSAAGAITCSSTQPCVGSTITCSITPVAGADSYIWSLPAGWTGTSTTNSISVTAGTGSGNVTVTPTNGCGNGTASSEAVSSADIPVASFTTSITGLNVGFTDASTNAPTSWSWDFGDSNTSPQQNPNHTFSVGGTYNVCLTSTNVCGSSVQVCQNVVVSGTGTLVWTGAVSTDWNNPLNWLPNTVPNYDNVTIPDVANDPIIGPGVHGYVNDINCAAGATITIQTGQTLSISGDWTWPGSHTLGGEVIFNGTAAQTTTGILHFNDLTVENDLSLSGITSVTRELIVDGGILNTNNQLTINSSASSTGWIMPYLNGGSIVGRVDVQRHIASSGFHYFGSPVNSPLMEVEITELNLSGPNGGQVIPTAACSSTELDAGSPYGNVFEWNQGNTFSGGCFYWGWNVRSSGSMTNARGYAGIFNTNLLSIGGTVNSGTVSNSGLLNSGGTGNGFHLVSNPYPGPMLWVAPAGFDGAAYFWQNSGTYSGTYQPFLSGFGHQIASMQGFFVRVSGASANFTTTDAQRISGDPLFYREADPITESITIDVKGSGFADKAIVAFNDQASDDWNGMLDAQKIPGNSDQPSIYTRNTGEPLSINCVKPVTEEKFVVIGFDSGGEDDGIFDFEFTVDVGNPPLVYLEDRVTGSSVLIENGAVYRFMADGSDIEGRFMLHFYPKGTTTDNSLLIYSTQEAVRISSSNELIGSQLTIRDVVGKVVHTQPMNGTNISVPTNSWSEGTYFVQVNGKLNQTKKVMVVK